ncbi:MAG: MASE1 domain-containing protein [Opitutales bacterium]
MLQERRRWVWGLFWLGLAGSYFLTGRLCIAISAAVANVSWVLYIPAGLSLTAALLWGRRVWPGVFAGELAVGLATGEPPWASLLMAAGNALECALAGWWFRDRLDRRIEFDRLQDVVELLAAELLILQPLSMMFGMFALDTAGHIPPGRLFATASAWYAANIFAQLVMAPSALVWIRWSRPAMDRRGYRELAALGTVTLLVGALGAGRWAMHGLPLPVTLIFVFPLLVWASVRFVPSVAVTVGSVLGLFAFDAVLRGTGPFSAVAGADQMFYLNLFMGVCIGTSLFLAAAMGQERKFEIEQARLIEELRAKSEQVRRLEEFVTFCAWTRRVRWNEQWVPVEQFLQERYGLSISHGISEEALAMLRNGIPELSLHPPPVPPELDRDKPAAG